MFSDEPGMNGLVIFGLMSEPEIQNLLIFALFSVLFFPFLMWLYGFEEKRERAKQEEILEQKRELNKKRIIEAEKRAAIHKSLRPSREELERKRQEELIEENRKRLASKQPDDDSELARLQRLKADWLEDKIE
jgi:hypothetical protein